MAPWDRPGFTEHDDTDDTPRRERRLAQRGRMTNHLAHVYPGGGSTAMESAAVRDIPSIHRKGRLRVDGGSRAGKSRHRDRHVRRALLVRLRHDRNRVHRLVAMRRRATA